jgi:hypothetical protein
MKQPPAVTDRQEETAAKDGDAGKGKNSADATTAQPAPEKKIITQPAPEKKLIAQPAYMPPDTGRQQKRRGKHDPGLMEALMLATWTRQARPVSYLPSAITSCRSRDREITCFSDDQTRNSGGNTVRYKTKAIISDFAKDGSFTVRYRNLVVNSTLTVNADTTQPDAFDDDGSGSSRVVNTGWGMSHTAECTLHDEFTITCVKDRSRRVEITSQQSMANGR